MPLKAEQLERVRFFLEDEWVDPSDDSRSQSNFNILLSQVESYEELHEMVRGFNWGCGAQELKPLLSHPLADYGTVLMAYWMAGPMYFQQYAQRSEIPSHEVESIDMVLWLHSLLLERKSLRAHIEFDPKNDEGYDWTARYAREGRRLTKKGLQPFYEIPAAFFACSV